MDLGLLINVPHFARGVFLKSECLPTEEPKFLQVMRHIHKSLSREY